MNRCDEYRSYLVDHVYGLLEGELAQEAAKHFEECPACQAELAKVQAQERLFKAAARMDFAPLTFEAPAVVRISDEMEPRSASTSSTWFRVAVAAAILVVIGGLGIPGGISSQYRDRADQAQARMDQIQKDAQRIDTEYRDQKDKYSAARDSIAKEILSIDQEINKLDVEYNRQVEKVRNEYNSRNLHMTITGPKTPEPGAPNNYQIETRSLNRQPLPANLSVRVYDEKQQVLYEVKDAPSKGVFQLTLPKDLPLKPDKDITLEVSAKNEAGKQEQLTEKLRLVAPQYLTHLTTDKPMYQPGEVVHFRSLTLDRFSMRPAPEDLQLVFTLTKPNGQQVQLGNGISRVVDDKEGNALLGPDKKPIRGIGAGEYLINEDVGGEYTITVRDAANRFPQQQRKFIVNKYEKPRLNKELEFGRRSYGAGESGTATCKVARVEGGKIAADLPVSASINVDGQVIAATNGGLRTDATGSVDVKFTLPAKIERGDASLSVTFSDGGSTEVIVRPIPIVLKKLEVEFFPEGGDLVAGVPNRLYFQARTTLGKPAEFKGRVLDDTDAVVADVQTFSDPAQPYANHGMGWFQLTPLAGKKYRLKIDEPVGIEEIAGPGNAKGGEVLPKVEAEGVVLTVPTGVTSDKDSIRAVARSAKKDRTLLIGAYCRGRLMAHQRIEAKAGQAAEVELKPESGVGGVYRVTVFEEISDGKTTELLPKAERLVYRVPAERLNLSMTTDKQNYVPGDQVKLLCIAKDEKDKPAPAILLVAVTDKSIVKMADEKTFKHMPTHFLLTTEVRRPEDLEHADFLVGTQASAHTALDLLLGTQGWRRFAEQNPSQFRNKHREEADRVLVSNTASRIDDTDFAQARMMKVAESYEPKFEKLLDKRTQVEEKSPVLPRPDDLVAQRQRLDQELAQARVEHDSAVAALDHYKRVGARLQAMALPALMLTLLVGGLLSLAVGLYRKSVPQALPFLITSACSILLFCFVAGWQLSQSDSIAALSKTVMLDKPVWTTLSVDELAQMHEAPREAGAAAANAPLAEGIGGGRGPGKGEAKADDKAPQNQLFFKRAENEKLKAGLAMPAAPAAKGAPADGRGFGLPGALAPMAPKPDAANFRFGTLKKMADKEMKEQRQEQQLRLRAGAPGWAGMGGMGLNRGLAGGMPGPGGPMPAARALQERRKLLQNADRDQLGDFEMKDAKEGRLDFDRKAREATIMAMAPPFVVRQYAHVNSRRNADVRTDFTETIYWHPVLVLPDGTPRATAEVTFQLPDSVTTFEVLAAGHTLDGRLGAVTSAIESRLPLTVEPKLPIEVTNSDKIDIPVAVANNTSGDRKVNLHVEAKGLTLAPGQENAQVDVKADSRSRKVYRVQPSIVEGEVALAIDGSSDAVKADKVERKFKVVPDGFPVVGSHSDLLEKSARNAVILPKEWLKGTLKAQVTVYPSTLADLQKGLEALLREPNGCFEQTSTSNYPNLLVLDYLKESDQLKEKPEAARRAQDLLGRGYAKLTSFECMNTGKNQREGYEWFGGTAPAHEALTAYGLMQFRDMARVHDVDNKMVERTRNYLMTRKDGKGGFLRNPRALDTFGRAPDNVTNAYIVWALTESGKDDDISKELEALGKQAETSKDPYFLALVACSLLNRNQAEPGIALLKKIAEAQDKDGHLTAEKTSITGSGGRDLQIETTAIALFGWLKAQRPDLFTKNIQGAVKWIGQQRGGYGGFGSTQSTILALKALIAYAKANKKTPEAGEITLHVADKLIAKKEFAAGAPDALVLDVPDAEKVLQAGKNDVRVDITGKNVFPYTVTWSYRTLVPLSADKCDLKLTTKLDRTNVKEGETVRLTATIENVSGKGQGMAVAIIGIPAGLTIPEDLKQLKDLAKLKNDGTEPGTISFFEIRGRELVLYWRDMAPAKKVDVSLDLICRVPGEYRGPASRAYLYYNADHKFWVEPLALTIAAKAAE